MQEDVEAKLGRTFETFETKTVAYQQVAGLNAFLAIQVDNDEYIHVRAFQEFSGAVHLVAVQTGKTASSPLSYFQHDSIAAAPSSSSPAPGVAAKPGAMKGVQAGDAVSQEVADLMRSSIDARMGDESETHECVEYATQVVAGTNYFLNIDRGNGNHVHARVYRSFANQYELVALQAGKTPEDPLVYFQDSAGLLAVAPVPAAAAAAAPAPASSSSSGSNKPRALGAMANVSPADDAGRAAASSVKAEVEAKTGETYETYTVTEQAVQRVSGTNYFLKIDVGNGAFIMVRAWVGFGGETQLHSVVTGMSEVDDLKYFDKDSIVNVGSSAPARRAYGALQGVKPGDAQAQEVADLMRSSIDAKVGGESETHECVEYATQMVAGTNFFLNINRGDGNHVHARVYRNFSNHFELVAVQAGKSADDALEYFQDSAGLASESDDADAASSSAPRAFGAASGAKDGDEFSQMVADSVRESLENIDHSYGRYEVVEYLVQTVAGKNVFLNIQVADTQFVHARVFCGLDGSVHLVKVRPSRTASHSLEYF